MRRTLRHRQAGGDARGCRGCFKGWARKLLIRKLVGVSRPAVAHPLAATWGLAKPFPGRDVAHFMIKPSVVLRVWVA